MTTTLGQIIRNARQQKGLSQPHLAELCQIDETYISKIENDRLGFSPKPHILQTLAVVLELQFEEIEDAAEVLVFMTGRIPDRYIPFLQEHYQEMPALFRWLQADPSRIKSAMEPHPIDRLEARNGE